MSQFNNWPSKLSLKRLSWCHCRQPCSPYASVHNRCLVKIVAACSDVSDRTTLALYHRTPTKHQLIYPEKKSSTASAGLLIGQRDLQLQAVFIILHQVNMIRQPSNSNTNITVIVIGNRIIGRSKIRRQRHQSQKGIINAQVRRPITISCKS